MPKKKFAHQTRIFLLLNLAIQKKRAEKRMVSEKVI